MGGLFSKNKDISNETEKVFYRQHFWHRIRGKSANRFAKRESKKNPGPRTLTYNSRECLLDHGWLYAKGEKVGSYTATRDQIQNARTTTSKARRKISYVCVEARLNNEE